MHNQTLIPKEIRTPGRSTQVQLLITSHQFRPRDIPMFTRQIARLAGLGREHFAGMVFAAVCWVEVAEGCGAVAVGGHGERVDVVDEGAVKGG